MDGLTYRITENGGDGWYWEALTQDGTVANRGVANTRAEALADAEKVKFPSKKKRYSGM
jgi:hypothetical protein